MHVVHILRCGDGTLYTAPFNYRADVIGALHTHFANICDIADAFAAMFTVPRGASREEGRAVDHLERSRCASATE